MIGNACAARIVPGASPCLPIKFHASGVKAVAMSQVALRIRQSMVFRAISAFQFQIF
jgi:hypothetical protein